MSGSSSPTPDHPAPDLVRVRFIAENSSDIDDLAGTLREMADAYAAQAQRLARETQRADAYFGLVWDLHAQQAMSVHHISEWRAFMDRASALISADWPNAEPVVTKWNDFLRDADARAQVAEQELSEARAALAEYGQHRDCALVSGRGRECNCGFSAALAADAGAGKP